jgi:hypothetical protein
MTVIAAEMTPIPLEIGHLAFDVVRLAVTIRSECPILNAKLSMLNG